MRRRSTIRDVAHPAGVSPATVSRVLNGKDNVDPQLAQRVRTTDRQPSVDLVDFVDLGAGEVHGTGSVVLLPDPHQLNGRIECDAAEVRFGGEPVVGEIGLDPLADPVSPASRLPEVKELSHRHVFGVSSHAAARAALRRS